MTTERFKSGQVVEVWDGIMWVGVATILSMAAGWNGQLVQVEFPETPAGFRCRRVFCIEANLKELS